MNNSSEMYTDFLVSLASPEEFWAILTEQFTHCVRIWFYFKCHLQTFVSPIVVLKEHILFSNFISAKENLELECTKFLNVCK